jgi:SAM-dependent methyltransferase
MTAIDTASVTASLSRHLPLYRHREPRYQVAMLSGLRALWQGRPERLLDIGGGTGVIAQCIAELFPVGQVTAIDVVDRFCADLTVQTRTYDGSVLPFADGGFDAATINNVVHHIPIAVRVPLFREIARAVDGPLYIKDHEARGWLDHRRLALLDLIGNIPFGGMVRADYLTRADWQALADASGYRIVETRQDRYRGGAMAAAFPNRLEIAMRWERR